MTKPRFAHLRQKKWRFLSWGIGRQSTALAAMAALGEIPPFDMIFHADTGWERRRTYAAREFYIPWLEARGQVVKVVSAGNIQQLGAVEHIHIPFWTDTGGPLQRQCTPNFKILPIRRAMRQLAGFPADRPPQPAPGQFELTLGISLDEWDRMSTPDVSYMTHAYPLVEMGMTADDCVTWLQDHDLPAPIKSACVGCPYRHPAEWLEMQQQDPEEFAEACQFDEQNRGNPLASRAGRSTAGALYVYRAAVPLAEADLAADAAKPRRRRRPMPDDTCTGPYCMT